MAAGSQIGGDLSGKITNLLNFLIVIGRFVIMVSAVLVVIGGAIGGWNAPHQPASMPYGLAPFEPLRIATAAVGAIGGMILAGSVLGLAAAIFDIQRRVALAVPLTPRR